MEIWIGRLKPKQLILHYIPEYKLWYINKDLIPHQLLPDYLNKYFNDKELINEILFYAVNLNLRYKNFQTYPLDFNYKLLANAVKFLSHRRVLAVSEEVINFYKVIYGNFLKVNNVKNIKIGKQNNTWNGAFELLGCLHAAVRTLTHPVFYVGAQFEMWKSDKFKIPLPYHIIPDYKAYIRFMQFAYLIDNMYNINDIEKTLSILKRPSGYYELVAYIKNYLSKDPIKLYLVRDVIA